MSLTRAESRLIRIVAAVVATVAEDIEVDATAGGAAKLRQWTRATDGQQVSPFDQQQQEQGAQPPVPTGIHPVKSIVSFQWLGGVDSARPTSDQLFL